MCASSREGTATDLLGIIYYVASSIASPKPFPCLLSHANAKEKQQHQQPQNKPKQNPQKMNK